MDGHVVNNRGGDYDYEYDDDYDEFLGMSDTLGQRVPEVSQRTDNLPVSASLHASRVIP